MTKEDILKAITELPKVENKQVISSMNAINVDDLINAVDRFNKVPDYNDLLKENKKQKEVIDEAVKYIQNHQLVFKKATLEETEEWANQFYIDVLDILKESE